MKKRAKTLQTGSEMMAEREKLTPRLSKWAKKLSRRSDTLTVRQQTWVVIVGLGFVGLSAYLSRFGPVAGIPALLALVGCMLAAWHGRHRQMLDFTITTSFALVLFLWLAHPLMLKYQGDAYEASGDVPSLVANLPASEKETATAEPTTTETAPADADATDAPTTDPTGAQSTGEPTVAEETTTTDEPVSDADFVHPSGANVERYLNWVAKVRPSDSTVASMVTDLHITSTGLMVVTVPGDVSNAELGTICDSSAYFKNIADGSSGVSVKVRIQDESGDILWDRNRDNPTCPV